ncbi:myocardin-related transcription factor B isoform X2 [Aethina tumida]|nr:myocardin-related transcription factor B isoform X2 [Aethina tumida]XP_049818393.1 myocardin-related transcription factor B isoform X2 [Aethina tumida]XP_049818394.1 myocardin-related transcription factor B isoform X2 [Aethina tumida]XP_049818395.1 myocardin-related transcription factor B isoform X2 [Aethina tumida]
MADSGGGSGLVTSGAQTAGASSSPPRTTALLRDSPPKAVIDTSPIHIDQNKESLKVKLLLRRPFNQLVDQGIMPPHKTPAAYHGQRRQLERAKTGDMLKAKIQQRPPRQELERRHILDADPAHVDPSLAEKQRMLKKARLADQLNDQLSHRPGPLELIQKNILHTEEPIEQAVKTGRIPYKATSEGQLNRPQHPHSYITPEEDSQSSEGDIVSPAPSDVLETAAKSAGIVVSLIQPTDGTVVVTTAAPVLKDNSELVFAEMCRSVTAPLLSQGSASSPASLVSSTSTLSPLSSVASPVPSIISQPATPVPVPPPPPPMNLVSRAIPSPAKSDAPGKDKNRKKSKSKSAPKTRTIKFHEYKGPPSAQKNTNAAANAGESSYDLLLQQQTLLLQFQLQLQHKYPKIVLPVSQKAQTSESNNNNSHLNNQQPSPAASTSSESSTQARLSGRLEDMKVSDLKAELKRRSLPVSGSKQNLIDRLKSFTGEIINHGDTVQGNSMDQSHNSPPYQNVDSPQDSLRDDQSDKMEIGDPRSPDPSHLQDVKSPLQLQESAMKTNEEIVRDQQRKIEELQRELTLSQLKLQAATRSEPKTQIIALQKHLQARQQQQTQQNLAEQMRQLQALQARQSQVNEEQQRLQQQQHVAFQNQKNLTNGLVLSGPEATLVFNQLLQGKAKVINGHNRTNSLPSFVNITPILAATELKPAVKIETNEEVKPPPHYEEATKQINKKNNVKSQIVDDVLEILIKNGELPPSAANDPATPVSANSIKAEPVFPNAPPQQVQVPTQQQQPQTMNETQINANAEPNSPENVLGLDANDLILDSIGLDNIDFSQLEMELGENQQSGDNNNTNNDDDDVVPMDTDEWLETFLRSENTFNGNSGPNVTQMSAQSSDLGYDPLLGLAQDPFDPFNLDEFRTPADLTASLSWDKIDYAT